MLYLLQYLAIIAAFGLPFLLGGLVRFTKSGEKRKRMFCIVGLAIAAACLALAVGIAFGAPAAVEPTL